MKSSVFRTHRKHWHRTCTRHAKFQERRSSVLWVPLLLAITAGVLILGCPPPEPPTITHALSGKLIDAATGAPIVGGIVDFAGISAKSGADGTYSLDLGKNSGTVI